MNTFEKAYGEAFDLACTELLKLDIHTIAANAGATLVDTSGPSLEIVFLNKTMLVEIPEFSFSTHDGSEVSTWEKILILHYLLHADRTPLQNELINFKQVTSGINYFPSFDKRCVQPLLKFYIKDPQSVIVSALQFGAEKAAPGDASFKIQAFPFVPVTFVFWNADNDFPSSGSILFDASIEHYLSTEDIVVLCQQITLRILKTIL